MQKTIYVAGPMRGYDQWNFPAFDANAAFLSDCGWNVISPAQMDREIGFDGTDMSIEFTPQMFKDAMHRDYAALLRCDAIAFIPGWEHSTGAKLERDFANRLGLEMYRVDAAKNLFEREVVIGLSGVARAGKDTLAALLVEKWGFQRRGFADALRNVLYALNPIVGLEMPMHYKVGTFKETRVQSLVDEFGWDKAKMDTVEIRQLLQRLGTEGGREHIADDIWIRTLFEKPHLPRLVVSDVRFPNEAAAIHQRGGLVARIERPGFGAINSHVSESAMSQHDWDFVITNGGDPIDMLAQLEDQVLIAQGIRVSE